MVTEGYYWLRHWQIYCLPCTVEDSSSAAKEENASYHLSTSHLISFLPTWPAACTPRSTAGCLRRG